MKKLIVVGILSLMIGGVFAQPGDRQMNRGAQNERIEAMKISFITQRLNLSPKQAQEFWPVYNQMTAEIKAVKKNNDGRTDKSFDELTDAEVEANIEHELDKTEKILGLKRKHINELKKVLSIKQVAKLLMAEEQFKRRLLDHMSNRNKQMGGRD